MLKVEKLPSGSYRFRKVIDGKRYTFTTDRKPTQREIEKLIADKIAELGKNHPQEGTFIYYAYEYISVKDKILSASTKRSYKSYLKNMDTDFLNMELADITQADVQKLVNDMTDTLSPKSIKNRYSLIASVLDMYYPDLKLHITLPQLQPNEMYIPTAADIKKVLDVCTIEKYWIMFMLGCYGLRRSEAMALTMDDVEDELIHINKALVYTEDKEWVVQPFNKTVDSTRDVPVDKELTDRIKAQGFVWQGHPRKIIEYLNSCQKKAGIPKFKYHALRHFFVTELSQAGFSDADIMALGGYSSDFVMKKVYRHNRIENDKKAQKKAAKKISSILK